MTVILVKDRVHNKHRSRGRSGSLQDITLRLDHYSSSVPTVKISILSKSFATTDHTGMMH